MRMASLVAFIGVFFSACSPPAAMGPFTAFADPGKYEFHSCDQIAAQRTYWKGREEELEQLMAKAEKGTGGAFVNVIAYKADHMAAGEELKVLAATARDKRCN